MITKDQTGEAWITASASDKTEYVTRKCAGAHEQGIGTADPSVVKTALDEFFAIPGNRHKTVSIAFGLVLTAISLGRDYKDILPPT